MIEDKLISIMTGNADLITDADTKDIQKQNDRDLKYLTAAYDPETLRRQFEKKRYGKVEYDDADTTAPGEYLVHKEVVLPLMTKREAKNEFWIVYKTIIQKSPTLTENNVIALEEIILWLINEGPLSTDKGIYIFGDYGRGKSDLIKSMNTFSLSNKAKYSNVRSLPLAKEYKFLFEKAEKGESIKKQYMIDKPVTIDDIGFKHESKINHYGNKKDIVTNIIYTRHSIWKRDKTHTSIFTSNLYPEDIQSNHGEGVSSRLKEMCNLILWDGKINLREI